MRAVSGTPLQKASGTMRRHCAQLRPIVGTIRHAASRPIGLRRLAVFCTLLLLSAVESQSAMAQCPPHNSGPLVIENFTAAQIGTDMWQVTGQIVCSDPASVFVVFGGLTSGECCLTDESGNFTFAFYLPRGESGFVTAIAYSPASDEVETYILND
jgi:hypothetical protein